MVAKGQTLSHQLILVLQGNLQYKRDGKVVGQKFQALGELDVYELQSNKAPDDIIANGDCVISWIKISNLTKSIGGALKDVTEANKKRFEV